MFAVMKTGGKQYRVAVGDQLRVEKLVGEPGEIVELNEVLMIGDAIGAPNVDGAMVAAEILEQGRARKVIAFKKRRRQNSRRTIGHRQHNTLIEITELLTGGKKPSKKASGGAKADKKAAGSSKPAAKTDKKADDSGKKQADSSKKESKESGSDQKADTKADKKPVSEEKTASPKSDAPLFKAPKGEPDDLTKIKGIGPVAKDQLAEQGITQFAQVAKLTDKEIEIIDEAMPFSADQISDWRAQAKDMVKG